MLIVRPAILDCDVLAFNESNITEIVPKGIDNVREASSLRAPEKSDHGHRQLRAPRAAKQRHRRAA
jgi:hypothetical protein